MPQGMENMKGIFGESAVAAGHRGNITGVSSEDCGQQELRNMHQLPSNFAQSSAIPHLSTANHKDSSIICLVDRLNFSANTMTSSSSPSSIKPSTSSCVGELLRLLPESTDVRSHARQAITETNSERYHIRNDDDDDDDDGESVHLGGSDNRIVQKQQQHKQEQTSHTTYNGAAGGGLNCTYSSHGTRFVFLSVASFGSLFDTLAFNAFNTSDYTVQGRLQHDINGGKRCKSAMLWFLVNDGGRQQWEALLQHLVCVHCCC